MGFATFLLMFLLLVTAAFLVVLVLIQRGKGGGLAGAFGGMGGQSAFGTKAGDLFTKITIGVAAVWIVLCVVTIRVLGIAGGGPLSGPEPSRPGATAPASTEKKPAGNAAKPASPAPAKTPEKTK